jgi:transcriptional regulator with XRE-family HTH domain
MDLRHHLARNVQRLRRELGWSQEDLSYGSGLHRTYVSGIERATRNPTLLILERLARALGLSAAELLASTKSQRGRS